MMICTIRKLDAKQPVDKFLLHYFIINGEKIMTNMIDTKITQISCNLCSIYSIPCGECALNFVIGCNSAKH